MIKSFLPPEMHVKCLFYEIKFAATFLKVSKEYNSLKCSGCKSYPNAFLHFVYTQKDLCQNLFSKLPKKSANLSAAFVKIRTEAD